MLSEARNYLLEHHEKAKLYVYGQDFNPRSYAVAASDLLMKENPKEASQSTIRFGDTLLNDQFKYDETNSDKKATFDYFLANPPFGVDWKRQSKEVKRESEKEGFSGRFGAGTPRVNDGALLFLSIWSASLNRLTRNRTGMDHVWPLCLTALPCLPAGPFRRKQYQKMDY